MFVFFETLACCLIVFIHCGFPGDFGMFVNSLAKFGVSLFFAVSGFFLYKEGANKKEIRLKLRKRAFRISLLLLFSFTIYFLLGILGSCFGKNAIGISEYLQSTFHWRKIIILLVCNDPLTNVINWFMIALLFSYLVIYLFPMLFFKNDAFLYVISGLTIFWIVFRITVTAVNAKLFGIDLSAEYLYRSWYANALLFVSFGILLKKKELFLAKIPTIVILIILLVSIVLMVLEQFLMIWLFGIKMSYYFGSIGCVFAMIAFSIKKPYMFSNVKILNMKGSWTTFVYIFHVAVTICLTTFLSRLGIEGAAIEWFKPLIVLGLSICLAILFNSLIVFIKDKKKVFHATIK